LDSTFNPSASLNSTSVNAIVVQSDGKILFGGTFEYFYGGVNMYGIGRLNSDGSPDTSFGTTNKYGVGSFSYSVTSIGLQSNGKIIIGGNFTTYNGTTQTAIARLNTDGSLDTTFASTTPGGASPVTGLVVQSNDQILVVGPGMGANGVARLKSNGSLDSSFTAVSGGLLNTVAAQSDGKVLIGGYNPAFYRFTSTGSLDSSFTPTPSSTFDLLSIIVQTNGKILLGGSFSDWNSLPCGNITRLNSNGTQDIFASSTGTNGYVYAIAVQSDGKILIGGSFTSYNGISRGNIARLWN
jgi:uncharacterized delta-60 repeat protein